MSNLAEIQEVVRTFQGLNLTWAEIAQFAKGKLVECGINGGITTYTVNGRTTAHDVTFFEKLLNTAEKRINGGMRMQLGETD